ncbi:MAG: lamin tail domain-containing protein [Myxococcota bacterium]
MNARRRFPIAACLCSFGLTGCALVMDTDFDDYQGLEPAEAAGGAAHADAGDNTAGSPGADNGAGNGQPSNTGGFAGAGSAGSSRGSNSGDAGGAAGVGGIGGSGGPGPPGGSGGHETGATCNADIVINEVQTTGPNGPDDEFVELYNRSDCPVSLDELTLVYRAADAIDDHGVWWSGEPGQRIESKGFFVIAGPAALLTEDACFPAGMALSAGGGGLAIRRSGVSLDRVGWGNANNGFVDVVPAPAPGPGQAISRRPDGHDTDNNMTDFAMRFPTPGGSN